MTNMDEEIKELVRQAAEYQELSDTNDLEREIMAEQRRITCTYQHHMK